MEILISWVDGNCPVQGEGMVDGKPFYFRARGQKWSMTIGNYIDPDWYYEESYGEGPFDAGWMSNEEAMDFIYKALDLYQKIIPSSSKSM